MRNYKISRRNFLAVAGTLTAAARLDRLRRLRKQHSYFQHGFFRRGK